MIDKINKESNNIFDQFKKDSENFEKNELNKALNVLNERNNANETKSIKNLENEIQKFNAFNKRFDLEKKLNLKLISFEKNKIEQLFRKFHFQMKNENIFSTNWDLECKKILKGHNNIVRCLEVLKTG